MPNAAPKGGKSLNGEKVYVDVVAEIRADGTIVPKQLTWEDGTKYEIGPVSNVCPSPASVGGQGDRYTVLINNRSCYIFFEHNTIPYTQKPGRWFVERKRPKRQ